MPLRNRVTPFGEIAALPGRGLVLGNRGVLHDDAKQIVRLWQVRRWIACRLAHRDAPRELMRPRSWTELFFLDEAAAFAAGHRPCAACRYPAFARFRALWLARHGGTGRVDDIDVRLHADRLAARTSKRTYRARLGALPNGAYVACDGDAALVWNDRLFLWTDAGYRAWVPRADDALVDVLTPRAIVDILATGYVPETHPTAQTCPAARR